MTTDLTTLLQQLTSSPELADALRSALFPGDQPQTAKATFEHSPCPSTDDLTLLQATFYDNGPDGERKPKEARFKITLEAWTDEADEIMLSEWNWKRSITIRDKGEFKKQIARLKKLGSISPNYFAVLSDVLSSSEWNVYFGLIGDKGSKGGKKGTNYYDGQFIVIVMGKNELPERIGLITSMDGAPITVNGFVPTDMKGNDLKGKAKAQLRHDICGYHKDWGTTK